MATPSAWLRALAAGSALFLTTSCYYDGYYSTGYSGYSGYSGGYSNYGYSGGGVTFVYTSSDRWFYDPDLFCYYDRHRHCYYDPYLGGYYPRGYCPRPVYGLPHPGGWSPGRGHCPPPSNFRDRYLSNYDNRVAALRARNESWSGRVQVRNTSNLEGWRSSRLQQAREFRGTASNPYRPQPSQQDNRRGSSNPVFRQDNNNNNNNSWFGRPNTNNPGNQNSGGRWGGSSPQRLQNNRPGFNQPVVVPNTNRTPAPAPRPSVQPTPRPAPSTPSRQGWERADRIRENREIGRQNNENRSSNDNRSSNRDSDRSDRSSGRDALQDRFRNR